VTDFFRVNVQKFRVIASGLEHDVTLNNNGDAFCKSVKCCGEFWKILPQYIMFNDLNYLVLVK